jgi:hypothetical protein
MGGAKGDAMNNPIAITLRLPSHEAWALAEMCKRFCYEDAEPNRHDVGRERDAIPFSAGPIDVGGTDRVILSFASRRERASFSDPPEWATHAWPIFRVPHL